MRGPLRSAITDPRRPGGERAGRVEKRGITAGLSEVRAKTCGFIRYSNVSKPGEARAGQEGGKVALGVAREKQRDTVS